MKRFFLFCLALFLSGCHVGPVYREPCPSGPPGWKNAHSVGLGPCCEGWWEVFGDPLLSDLENQAVQASPDVYIALSRIMEARGIAGIARGFLFPDIKLNPSYTNTGMLFKAFAIPSGLGIPNVFRIHQMQYYFPFDMRYQLDLWGGIRDQYDAARRFAQAQEYGLYVSLLSLTSDLASHYFNIRTIDAQSCFYQTEIALRKASLALNETRYQEGLIGYLDVAGAEVELANLEADYAALLRQRGIYEDAIAVIIGVPASEFCVGSSPLCYEPPVVPPGVPCSVLLKRPDVHQAERMRASAHAIIGVAYSTFFPDFTLTGTLGFFSPTLRDFFTAKSLLWSIGLKISQMIFDGGKRAGFLQAALGRFREEDARYQKTILTAFQEVEDALNNLQWQQKQFCFLKEAKMAATQRRELSQERYSEGLVNYLEVIDSERTETVAGLNQIATLGARYQSTIQLIKAIGGSWECADPATFPCPCPCPCR